MVSVSRFSIVRRYFSFPYVVKLFALILPTVIIPRKNTQMNKGVFTISAAPTSLSLSKRISFPSPCD